MQVLPLSSRIKAALRKPKEISSFSIDINNEFCGDDRSLAYYYFPETTLDNTEPIDLLQGFKEFKRKDESKALHLDNFLKSLIIYENDKNAGGGNKVKADIITWRGILTKLLVLPYNVQDDIDLNIMLFDDQIFIEEDHELTMANKRPMDEKAEVLAYSGFKFEGVATLKKPWSQTERSEIEGRYTAPVNNIEQYCSVVRTGVGNLKIVLAGEVDCVNDFKPNTAESKLDPLEHYVELKCSKSIRDERDARNFERKLLKSWAQSFLIGVPKIVYGFRDDRGFLKCVEEYDTQTVPALIKESKITSSDKKWNGNDAIAFYAAVLEWINKVVRSEPEPGVIWRLHYRSNTKHIELKKNGSDIKGFLSDEFIDHRNSLKTRANE